MLEGQGIFLSIASVESVETVESNNNTTDERIVELDNEEDIKDPILELSSTDGTINYEECSIKELRNTLEDMGLSVSGSKTKLIERIVSNKNKI